MRMFGLFFLLGCTALGFLPLKLRAQSHEGGGAFVFGTQVAYQPTLWNGRGGLVLANHYPVGLFAGWHFENVDMGPPLLGFGVRFVSIGLQTGLFYHAMHVCGSRQDVDPQATVLFCHTHERIPFHVKSLRVPVSVRHYMGKNRRWCFFWSLHSIFILSVAKNDWQGAFAEQFGCEVLKSHLKYGGAPPYEAKTDADAAYRKKRDAFYAAWKRRPKSDRYTAIPISDVFARRYLWGGDFGLSYEMDMGVVFTWTMLAAGASTSGMGFALGYDFNRLLQIGQ